MIRFLLGLTEPKFVLYYPIRSSEKSVAGAIWGAHYRFMRQPRVTHSMS